MSTIRTNAILDAAGGNTAQINGITPALASQAEAEAGTDNTKLMTSLRSAQAMGVRAIGINQSWNNVSGSRAPGTVYTNTTGRPIMVNITFNPTGSTASVLVAGIQVGATTTVSGYSNYQTISFIVPAGNTYQTSNIAGSISYWAELR